MTKEKYQSKYMTKDAAKEKKPVGLIILLVVLLLAVAAAAAFYFLGGSDTEKPTETAKPTAGVESENQNAATVPTMGKIEYETIETSYGLLQIDKAYAEKIRHEELVQDDVMMEVFYMIVENDGLELFRICYGATETGNLLGKMLIDGQEIPVSVAISDKPIENYLGEELKNDYYVLMEQVNVVLESIRSNSNFVPLGSQSGTETSKQDVSMMYWSMELPDSISWKETTSDDSYCVDFYGTVAGRSVHLYTISLGADAEGNVLGQYVLNGEQVPVCVVTYTAKDQSPALPENYESEYAALMDSIDAVIQAITSDSNYSNGIG